jgi:hypothetical protein
MKFLKQYENFITDLNRDSSALDYVPKHNPVINQKAQEFVDSLMHNNYELLFKVAGIEMPKDLDSTQMDPLFDEVREKAIEYFIQNPEAIGKEDLVMKQFKVNAGDGIPRVSNVGGTSHAASLRIGESKSNFDTEIEISEDDMSQFNSAEPLIELIRNRKVALGNKKISFNKSDKETIKTLDTYFEFDQSSFDSDEEETTE